jgi:aryl-alcohol dehydrogenase-like predicted oxidoreductase
MSPATTVQIGDLEVQRPGFGAMQLPGPGVWGEPRDPERARAVLRRAVEIGVNLIDTAWYYGPLVSNRLIAEALYPYPKGLVIATKLGGRRTPDKAWHPALRPEQLREGCESDLASLKLERTDITHLRWMPADVPFEEALDALIALQKEGKIRHIALSNVTSAQLEAALKRTPIVAVQNLYNAAAGEKRLQKLAHAMVSEQEVILKICEAKKLAFLPFFPLAIPGVSGLKNDAIEQIAQLRGKTPMQIALAWMLTHSPVLVPIPGTSSPEHLEENQASARIELDPDEMAAIDRARDAT